MRAAVRMKPAVSTSDEGAIWEQETIVWCATSNSQHFDQQTRHRVFENPQEIGHDLQKCPAVTHHFALGSARTAKHRAPCQAVWGSEVVVVCQRWCVVTFRTFHRSSWVCLTDLACVETPAFLDGRALLHLLLFILSVCVTGERFPSRRSLLPSACLWDTRS